MVADFSESVDKGITSPLLAGQLNSAMPPVRITLWVIKNIIPFTMLSALNNFNVLYRTAGLLSNWTKGSGCVLFNQHRLSSIFYFT